MRHLYTRAKEIIGTRSVLLSRVQKATPFHEICHRAAHAVLREHVRILLDTDSEVRLRDELRRRKEWRQELNRLHIRTREVEGELRACNSRITRIRASGQEPADA